MKELSFQEGDTKSFENAMNAEMESPIKHFEKELASIRTGRAHTALLDGIKVEVYGQFMPLRELATMTAPESRLLVVQPWDKGNLAAIEKALVNSDLGAKPVNDGNIIRIQLPQMSEARREELVKVLGKKTEECKIGVRNIRKEFHNEVRDAQAKKIISEDFAKRLSGVLQTVTDKFIAKADSIHEKKSSELRTI